MDDESNLTFSSTMISKNLPRFNRKGKRAKDPKGDSSKKEVNVRIPLKQWDQGKSRDYYQQCLNPHDVQGDNISRERGGATFARDYDELSEFHRWPGRRTITNRLLAARPNGIEINDLIMPADVIIYMNAL